MRTFDFFPRRRVSGFNGKYFSFWSLYVDISITEKQQQPYIMVMTASGYINVRKLPVCESLSPVISEKNSN